MPVPPGAQGPASPGACGPALPLGPYDAAGPAGRTGVLMPEALAVTRTVGDAAESAALDRLLTVSVAVLVCSAVLSVALDWWTAGGCSGRSPSSPTRPAASPGRT